jgi:hypothetical protein
MDRRSTLILGGAIVLGFLVVGLSQLGAQRFPGDARGSGEGMVGRYQVVRSSPESVLLLDTVTGELYIAGRDDIRPSSARPRGGEIGDPHPHPRQDGRFEKVGPPKDAAFSKDKGDFKNTDFKDKGPKD